MLKTSIFNIFLSRLCLYHSKWPAEWMHYSCFVRFFWRMCNHITT